VQLITCEGSLVPSEVIHDNLAAPQDAALLAEGCLTESRDRGNLGPDSLTMSLRVHIEWSRRRHRKDLSAGLVRLSSPRSAEESPNAERAIARRALHQCQAPVAAVRSLSPARYTASSQPITSRARCFKSARLRRRGLRGCSLRQLRDKLDGLRAREQRAVSA
jgi:hypothetical protein